jgi:hypothetical protein
LRDRLDRISCKLDPLLVTQQLQQHEHPLVRAQSCEQPNLILQPALQNLHPQPGLSPCTFGSSTNPARSRDLISLITTSGMRAGNKPSMIKRTTPGDHRASHQPRTTHTNKYPGNSGGVTMILRLP